MNKNFYIVKNLNMNKNEFVKELSMRTSIDVDMCKRILNEEYDIVCEKLRCGEEVNISKFGKFYVRTQKERVINNFLKGRTLFLPLKNIATFKPSKIFKEVVD